MWKCLLNFLKYIWNNYVISRHWNKFSVICETIFASLLFRDKVKMRNINIFHFQIQDALWFFWLEMITSRIFKLKMLFWKIMHMPSELLILFYVFRSAGLIQTLYFRIFCINICKRFAVSSRRFLNPFQSVWFHIETTHLLCRAKQMIGFYMKRNAG